MVPNPKDRHKLRYCPLPFSTRGILAQRREKMVNLREQILAKKAEKLALVNKILSKPRK